MTSSISSSFFFFTKLAPSSDGKAWYLQTLWTAETLTVYATDCVNVWKGVADAAFIRTSLKPDEVSTSEYLDLIRPALTQEAAPGARHSCSVGEGSGGEAIVSWKVSLDEHFSLKGSLKLAKVSHSNSNSPMEVILCMNAERLASLERTSQALQRECDELRTKAASTCAELAKIVERKGRLEMDMYKKFCVILNQKKEKIRSLKASLEAEKNRVAVAAPFVDNGDGNTTPVIAGEEGVGGAVPELDNDSADEGDECSGGTACYDGTLNPDMGDMPSMDLLDLSLDGGKASALGGVRRRYVGGPSVAPVQKRDSAALSLSGSLSSSSLQGALVQSLSSLSASTLSSTTSSSSLNKRKIVQQATSPAKKKKKKAVGRPATKTGGEKQQQQQQPKKYKQLRLDNMDPDDLIKMADT